MANEEQLDILRQGVATWNKWRAQNAGMKIDLSSADLNKADLERFDFRRVNLSNSNLREASLVGADLSFAHVPDANLFGANLSESNLSNAFLGGAKLENAQLIRAHLRLTVLSHARLIGANFLEANLQMADLYKAFLLRTSLVRADLRQADLRGADLSKADLSGANMEFSNLEGASFVETLIDGALISGSSVYGIGVWDLKGKFDGERDLIITRKWDPKITVDNLKVAQFIYLILNNEEIKHVIDTLTSKSVLILGRFNDKDRKEILEALRNELRNKYQLMPIVFDFDRPIDRNWTETIKTLAGLCYFVIADVTDPKSVPLELQAIQPDYQVPIVPIYQGELPFSMMENLQSQHGLMGALSYDTLEALLGALKPGIIDPAIERHKELRLVKTRKLNITSAKDFLVK